MQVRVAAGTIEVVKPEVLTALAVATSLSADDAVARLVADGLARGGEAGHAWLDVAELARRAAPEGDDAWRDGFDGMIAYAASRGWVVDGFVRAHVEGEQ